MKKVVVMLLVLCMGFQLSALTAACVRLHAYVPETVNNSFNIRSHEVIEGNIKMLTYTVLS